MLDRRETHELKKSRRKWEETTLRKTLAETQKQQPEFLTSSNLPVKPLYTILDVENTDYLRYIGFPGEYPYTRGIYPTMYRNRLWAMRQYAGFGTAEDTNKRYRYLISQGQTALSVAFDLPTQLGYDSDHPLALDEVGKVGVAISTLQDMETLFHGIPLDKMAVSMTANATAPIILSMYIAAGKRQGVPSHRIVGGGERGTTQNDVLKEYIARGMYIFPPEASMKLTMDICEYCSQNMSKWKNISVSGYHMREAGANAVQELAFTLANGIAYVEAAIQRGLNLERFSSGLSFYFGAHNNFFEEVAKLRAARRMWSRIMRDRFKAKNPGSWQLRFHAQTAGSTLTAHQPENNIVRVAIQALAAVLGGTQSLHTNSFDEALTLPSEKAVRIALRTQQIIAHETGVTETVDPLGGSFYLEHLTNQIEEEATRYLEQVEKLGGAVRAIETGYVQREIANSAYKYQDEVESKKRIVVGVNEFTTEEKVAVNILRVDPFLVRKRMRQLGIEKRSRSSEKVDTALDRLRKAAKHEENLMPTMIKAVNSDATLGEICDVLRERYGEYRAPPVF